MNAQHVPGSRAGIQQPGAARRLHVQAHLLACRRPADLFFTPRDIMDLSSFVRQLPPDVPVLWLGLGSNLLVRDGGLRGAVVSTHGALGALERHERDAYPCGSGRALRAHRAAMREVGLGARRIFCRHPRHLGRRAWR